MITTRDSFDERLTDDERQRFWALVRNTLELFDADPQLADDYQRELEDASVGERIAAYHASPWLIAADLAGWSEPISNEMLRKSLEQLQRSYHEETGLSLNLTPDLAKINKMMVGKSLVGDGNEVAHIDILIGPRGSAAETAFANALTNNKDGFTSLLAVVARICRPNLLRSYLTR